MPRLPEDPIARYRALVVRYNDVRDVRKANRAYDQMSELRRQIHRDGQDRKLLSLLDDPHPGVRYDVAFEALSIEPEEGVRVLRELAAGPRSGIRLDAEHTLAFYEAGTMDLRPWNKVKPEENEEDHEDDDEV